MMNVNACIKPPSFIVSFQSLTRVSRVQSETVGSDLCVAAFKHGDLYSSILYKLHSCMYEALVWINVTSCVSLRTGNTIVGLSQIV